MNSRELLQLYQVGRSEAATALFDRYVTRLLSLARSRLGSKMRRRVDADDIVQSAFRSFFVHAKGNEYQLDAAGDLWRLLASITLHKLHGEIEKQTASKRSVDREGPIDCATMRAVAPEPSAAEVIALVEELHLVLDRLTARERLMLTLRLQGQSIPEISAAIKKSERTTRRLLAKIEKTVEQQFTFSSTRSISQRPAVEPHAPLIFSDYVLEQLLGSGGMGKVFRAREKHTGKQVAIKALHKSRQSDERAVARIVHEAQIVAELHHANIVGVQGLGRFPGGGYFIVMDYVDGTDLQARLQSGPMSLEEVVRIAQEVAVAIDFAHRRGVVHCDLKPGNILLDEQGRVLVTDFGFAFLMADSAATTGSGVGGTAGFIAPEVLLGKSPPTPAADVYGLGMLMWTLSTGKPPDQYRWHTEAVGSLVRLHSLCDRCLTRDLEQRYQSIRELLTDLECLRDSSP